MQPGSQAAIRQAGSQSARWPDRHTQASLAAKQAASQPANQTGRPQARQTGRQIAAAKSASLADSHWKPDSKPGSLVAGQPAIQKHYRAARQVTTARQKTSQPDSSSDSFREAVLQNF